MQFVKKRKMYSTNSGYVLTDNFNNVIWKMLVDKNNLWEHLIFFSVEYLNVCDVYGLKDYHAN